MHKSAKIRGSYLCSVDDKVSSASGRGSTVPAPARAKGSLGISSPKVPFHYRLLASHLLRTILNRSPPPVSSLDWLSSAGTKSERYRQLNFIVSLLLSFYSSREKHLLRGSNFFSHNFTVTNVSDTFRSKWL